MFKKCGDKLLYPDCNTIRLSVHIDGVPLFHSSDYNLWPILASVGHKPVFIVGLYGGKSKPRCSNEYLKPLVDEICSLKENGLKVKGRVYRLVLYNIMMDTPARSYVLGVKGHTAKKCCVRCTVVGERKKREGLSSTSVQRKTSKRKALCFLALDAPKRSCSDFIFAENAPDCDADAGCNSKQCWTDHICDDNGFESEEEDDDDCTDDEIFEASTRDSRQSKASYFKHRTILTKIPDFNPLTDIPIDYTHLVRIPFLQ
jgi:hypothetical protein